MGVTASSFHL